VTFLDKLNETQVATAKLEWLRSHYPGTSTVDISFICVDRKPYDVHKIVNKEKQYRVIYFDVSNIVDEVTVSGVPMSQKEHNIRLLEGSGAPQEVIDRLKKDIETTHESRLERCRRN
jgi:hypothetical protein